jgi:hypothetical protein
LRGNLNKVVVVIAFISNQRVEPQAIEQLNGLRFVVAFAAGQDKAKRIAEGVNRQMNLGRMSAPTAT